MTKFEIGKTYKHGWIGDADLETAWEVIDRTEQTITIKNRDEIRRCRINKQLTTWENAECVYPFGRYSMCPILRAI